MIWGLKTTTQHAMEMDLRAEEERAVAVSHWCAYLDSGRGREDIMGACVYPAIPEIASTSRLRGCVGGAMSAECSPMREQEKSS